MLKKENTMRYIIFAPHIGGHLVDGPLAGYEVECP